MILADEAVEAKSCRKFTVPGETVNTLHRFVPINISEPPEILSPRSVV
ncbi:hypothetical protein [Arthrobacter sp. SX1312]|nr:hypothetical protein [Arthrobacter sp. SX1312]